MIATLVPLQAALVVLVGAGGGVVVFARNPLRQALALSVYGVLLVLLLLVFQAPDAALSELVVGSVAMPFIILAALAKIRQPREAEDEDE
jgi:energy-converting hydrogenase B subunit D